jgi:hypothetical protein
MDATPALAFVARRERRIVAIFRQKGATSGPTAQRLQQLGLNDGRILRGLIATSIIRKAGPERYFLNEQAWNTRPRSAVSPRAVGIAGLLLVVLIITIYLLQR